MLLSAGSFGAALMCAHRARGCRAVCHLVAGISPGAVTWLERAGPEAGTARAGVPRRSCPHPPAGCDSSVPMLAGWATGLTKLRHLNLLVLGAPLRAIG
jgi:hypothetical protein